MAAWKRLQFDGYRFTGIVMLALVCIALVYGGLQLRQLLANSDALPIDEVALVGKRQFTADDEVRQALHALSQDSLVTANMQTVQHQLEALPWVLSASVRREWPNRLRVYLSEQQPQAHWNQTQWLNQDAQVFDAPARPELKGLPKLTGPVDASQKVWQHWLQFSEYLKLNGFELAALELTARHAWNLTLANGLQLRLGRRDEMERLERFIVLWPTLNSQGRRAQYIDLRYDTGLAVGWHLEQQENA